MIDHLLSRTHNARTYNCWHFVREAWRAITGDDLGDLTPYPPAPKALAARIESERSSFKEIEEPVSPCLVVFSGERKVPHIAVYWKGKLLSLEKRGASHLPMTYTSKHFDKTEFYLP